MVLAEQQSISLGTGKYTWEEIDERSKKLGLNRSKYTQRLYELDLNYNLLSNNQLLHLIKNFGKKHLKFFEILVILFLLTIFSCILTLIWLLI